jgi:hypothetical protein
MRIWWFAMTLIEAWYFLKYIIFYNYFFDIEILVIFCLKKFSKISQIYTRKSPQMHNGVCNHPPSIGHPHVGLWIW